MVTMMQWCGIEDNKATITNNLREKYESIKRNGNGGHKEILKKGIVEESLWKKERCHATWRTKDSKINGAKSRHLRCYPPTIRPKK